LEDEELVRLQSVALVAEGKADLEVHLAAGIVVVIVVSAAVDESLPHASVTNCLDQSLDQSGNQG
jgi:transglutaminase/protease-like cytokinesis protein 3